MKKITAILVSLTFVFCLTGCTNGYRSLDKTLEVFETALENSDTEALMELMHSEADNVEYGMVEEDEEYDNYEEYFKEHFSKMKEEGDRINYKISKDEKLAADWEENLESVEEIIEDEDLDINVDDLTLCGIKVYVDGEFYDDGYVVFTKKLGKWQIVNTCITA